MAVVQGAGLTAESQGHAVARPYTGFLCYTFMFSRVGEGPSLCVVNLFLSLVSITEGPILIQVEEVKMAVSSVV